MAWATRATNGRARASAAMRRAGLWRVFPWRTAFFAWALLLGAVGAAAWVSSAGSIGRVPLGLPFLLGAVVLTVVAQYRPKRAARPHLTDRREPAPSTAGTGVEGPRSNAVGRGPGALFRHGQGAPGGARPTVLTAAFGSSAPGSVPRGTGPTSPLTLPAGAGVPADLAYWTAGTPTVAVEPSPDSAPAASALPSGPPAGASTGSAMELPDSRARRHLAALELRGSSRGCAECGRALPLSVGAVTLCPGCGRDLCPACTTRFERSAREIPCYHALGPWTAESAGVLA